MSFIPALITALDETIADAAGAGNLAPVQSHGLSLSFDWQTLRFRFDASGNPVIVSGQAALLEDIVKMLLTPRYASRIYTPDYGADWDEIIGDPYAMIATQIPRVVTEALSLDPRIRSVDNFDISRLTGTGVRVSFTVTDFNGDVLHVPEVVLRYG